MTSGEENFNGDFEKLRKVNFNDSKFDRIYNSMDFMFNNESIDEQEVFKKIPIFFNVNNKMSKRTVEAVDQWQIYSNSFTENFDTGNLKLTQLNLSRHKIKTFF